MYKTAGYSCFHKKQKKLNIWPIYFEDKQ